MNRLHIYRVHGVNFKNVKRGEFQIIRVILCSQNALTRKLMKFMGLSKANVIKTISKFTLGSSFINEDCYAVIIHSGPKSPNDVNLHNKEDELCIRSIIKKELEIFSSSQVGFNRRNRKRHVNITDNSSRMEYLRVDANSSMSLSSAWIGGITYITPNDTWFNTHKNLFFIKLLLILRGKIKVSGTWKSNLEKAASIIGQSQNSNDYQFAFLWNMIALEMLLTQQGDKFPDTLIERMEAFFGWSTNWKDDKIESRISDIYKKRCSLVHDGDASKITVDDVEFLDDLILGLLVNIVHYPKVFYSKKSLVDFATKYKCEKTLGIKSKVQPKKLRFIKSKVVPLE